jgi:hypothetical protein
MRLVIMKKELEDIHKKDTTLPLMTFKIEQRHFYLS